MQINEEELKKKLTPEQYKILREKGTEAPGSSPLLHEKRKGMFACVVCGNQLFSSETKFDSGTGWPSFDQALPGAVEYKQDSSHDMTRTEVVCANCGSHLGHVFDDGPATITDSTLSTDAQGGERSRTTGSRSSTGKRFCINGACLMHQPK
ncbi:MAG: peptide-methionine (R)-S-oxide reductase MsrB [Patescibacteria group bacterium]